MIAIKHLKSSKILISLSFYWVILTEQTSNNCLNNNNELSADIKAWQEKNQKKQRNGFFFHLKTAIKRETKITHFLTLLFDIFRRMFVFFLLVCLYCFSILKLDLHPNYLQERNTPPSSSSKFITAGIFLIKFGVCFKLPWSEWVFRHYARLSIGHLWQLIYWALT